MEPTPQLHELSTFDLIADVPGQFMRIKRTMLDISHALEDAAAASPESYVFVGFQRFSLIKPQLTRYLRLSSQWKHCWLFGVPDVAPPSIPNITPIAIDASSPLAQEWFVIVDGPAFGSALLTAETSSQAIGDPRRYFMGLWSADAGLVRRASTRLANALNIAAPTHRIDSQSTLRHYDLICNHLLAVHEERLLSAQVHG